MLVHIFPHMSPRMPMQMSITCVYKCTDAHVYMHAYRHAGTDTRAHAAYANACARLCKCMGTCPPAGPHAYPLLFRSADMRLRMPTRTTISHACVRACVHSHTCVHTPTRGHAPAHVHAPAYSHAHAPVRQTPPCPCAQVSRSLDWKGAVPAGPTPPHTAPCCAARYRTAPRAPHHTTPHGIDSSRTGGR